MKTIYIHYVCDEDIGECQGMFDDAGKLLDGWSCNDGDWRGEYFDGFMEKIGIKVKELPAKFKKDALKQLKEHFGL